jgi:hypothetical protein
MARSSEGESDDIARDSASPSLDTLQITLSPVKLCLSSNDTAAFLLYGMGLPSVTE